MRIMFVLVAWALLCAVNPAQALEAVAVPEPASLTVLGTAAAALLIARYRRRR